MKRSKAKGRKVRKAAGLEANLWNRWLAGGGGGLFCWQTLRALSDGQTGQLINVDRLVRKVGERFFDVCWGIEEEIKKSLKNDEE